VTTVSVEGEGHGDGGGVDGFDVVDEDGVYGVGPVPDFEGNMCRLSDWVCARVPDVTQTWSVGLASRRT
jgi:hypothetical protein